MRQYRAMIRYCFPHIDVDAIEDEQEFADIANEASWIVRNVMHPNEEDTSKAKSTLKPSYDNNVKRRTM